MLYQKMLDVMNDVNGEVAERQDLVEAIAIALLTRKNLFILGDTGQAKSYAINLFRGRITGARQFERLLSKQCDEEQLFGRIDLATLIPGNADADVLAADLAYQKWLDELNFVRNLYQERMEKPEECRPALDRATVLMDQMDICRRAAYVLHGNQPKIITTGKIPDSHIVFVDEVFKANDGVLNSLLTALNERRYTNEGQTIDIPTISFFGASNEIPNFNNPEEKILKPLYDRFELKVVTQYVESRANRLAVLRHKQAGVSGQAGAAITLDELYAMQSEVSAVAVPDAINELMDDILCQLREKGVHISDRKYFGYYPIAQAHAWLEGRDKVEAADLLALRFYLWTAPEDRSVIGPVLERMCNDPLQDKLDNLLASAGEAYGDFESATDAPPPRRIGKLRNELVRLYEAITQLQAAAQGSREVNQIAGTLDAIEAYSKKAHDDTGFAYVPLSEIYAIQMAT